MASNPPSATLAMAADCGCTLNCRKSGSAIAPVLPRSILGRFGPMATARNGEAFSSGTVLMARSSQPSSVAFIPGVPDSM